MVRSSPCWVANRLTYPTPLVRVEDWGEKWAVLEIFGIEPDALNDERCGRAPEALAGQADAVAGAIAARAIAVFGLDVSEIQWDLTSMSMFEAYDRADRAYATPKPGRPKDHRFDLKQVQAGFATWADGAVSLLTRVYDGGAAEVSQVEGALRALRELAGPRRFLLVGDSTLVSYWNLTAVDTAGATFVAPAPRAIVGLAALTARDPATATIVDWAPQREKDKAFHQRDVHRVIEGSTTLRGPKATDPPFTTRTVYSHSAARRGVRGQQAETDRQGARRARRAALQPRHSLLPRRGGRPHPRREDHRRVPGQGVAAHPSRHQPRHRQTGITELRFCCAA